MKTEILIKLKEICENFNSDTCIQIFIDAKKLARDEDDDIYVNILFANICRLIYINKLKIDIEYDLLIEYAFTSYIKALKTNIDILTSLNQRCDDEVTLSNGKKVKLGHLQTNDKLQDAISKYGSNVLIPDALTQIIKNRFDYNCDIDKVINNLSNKFCDKLTIVDIEKAIL